MLQRDYPPPSLVDRLRSRSILRTGEAVRWGWRQVQRFGAIAPGSPRAAKFGSFGNGSVMCFPFETIVNECAIHVGEQTIIAPYVALSAGWMPDQPKLANAIVTIGSYCVIGRGSSIIGHESIVIGDGVWTGPFVHITDCNHDYHDRTMPIGWQAMDPKPITIGDGSWLGHGTIVLPGTTIGRNVTIGANSVVMGDIPDYAVAVGSPARVVRTYDPAIDDWTATRYDTSP